jgi:hypothetical protein
MTVKLPDEPVDIREVNERHAKELFRLRAEVERLTRERDEAREFASDRDDAFDKEVVRCVAAETRVAALEAALRGVLAITDRKHVAWDSARAALRAGEAK